MGREGGVRVEHPGDDLERHPPLANAGRGLGEGPDHPVGGRSRLALPDPVGECDPDSENRVHDFLVDELQPGLFTRPLDVRE